MMPDQTTRLIMGIFNFGGKRETYLAVVTSEGPGRLRLNGVRVKDKEGRKAATSHDRTVCWVEFARDGVPLDRGVGRARIEAGQAERLLRDLPAMPTCRSV